MCLFWVLKEGTKMSPFVEDELNPPANPLAQIPGQVKLDLDK